MNDFNVDIKGLVGVVKRRSFEQKHDGLMFKTTKSRMFTIENGPGCSPEPGPRKVTGHWADGSRETLSSYDFEFVVKDGKEIFPTETPACDVDIAPEPLAEAAKTMGAHQVHRKRG